MNKLVEQFLVKLLIRGRMRLVESRSEEENEVKEIGKENG